MTKYRVWVSGGEGTPQLVLLEGEDKVDASNLAFALVGYSGSTTFSVGIDVVHSDDSPPPPTAGASGERSTRQTTPSAAQPGHASKPSR